MSFFDQIVGDIDKVQQEYLGPDYDYYKKIKTPSDLGMSGHGSIGALSSDIAGIVNYVELLVSGKGRASKTGRPLGDKFFLKTGGQCKDYKTNKLVTRSMYINNVPTADIPIISNISGMSFPEFKGLVPGTIQDLWSINPVKMFRAFTEGDEPKCAEVKLETIGSNDVIGQSSGYIPIVELMDLQSDGKIPNTIVTDDMKKALQNNDNDNNNDKETFLNMCDIMNGKSNPIQKTKSIIKQLDSISNVYIISIAIVFLYILYKMMNK
jgi:hypothetical protein